MRVPQTLWRPRAGGQNGRRAQATRRGADDSCCHNHCPPHGSPRPGRLARWRESPAGGLLPTTTCGRCHQWVSGTGGAPGPRALTELRKPGGRPHHTLWPPRGAGGGVSAGRGAEAGTRGLSAPGGQASLGRAGLAVPVGAPLPCRVSRWCGQPAPRARGKAPAAAALQPSGVRLGLASPVAGGLRAPCVPRTGSHALSGCSLCLRPRIGGSAVWPPPLPSSGSARPGLPGLGCARPEWGRGPSARTTPAREALRLPRTLGSWDI